MIIQDLGLQTDSYSWLVFLGVACFWWLSRNMGGANLKRDWPSIFTSPYGLTWLGFGITMFFRFLVLSYDSVTYGNQTYRLANLPTATVNMALMLVGAFWISVFFGYVCARSRRGPGPLNSLQRFTTEAAAEPLNPITVASFVGIILTAGPFELPLALRTPLAHLGSLWVVPAALVWWTYFSRPESGSSLRVVRWLVLAPGIVLMILSPYREHVVVTVGVPFLAALFAGLRPRLWRVIGILLVLLLVSTLVISVLRSVMWMDLTLGGAIAEEGTKSGSEGGAGLWREVVGRFHGLDSLLLTVDLVPRIFPYSERNVLVDSMVRGFVPRALYAGKELSVRGFEFSRTIWAFGEESVQEAAIAPSMPGDLYEAGGILYLVLGGLVWGLMVGAFDGWIRHLPASTAAAATAVFALQFAASAERDFAHVVATALQVLILLFLLMYFLPVRSRKRPSGEVEGLRPAQTPVGLRR